ncbi:MAG TPA: carbohydrate kinase family protein [Candidatus Atribacteria bacterium]|nr:carbohydrate kinase family protein [Candidatus Atribacteria bacterium]
MLRGCYKVSHVHCFDVIVVDDLIIDLLLELPEFPEPEKVILPLRFERQVGGNGNFLIMASRLGLSVKAIGCIGNDSNGRFLKESLLREGVNVEDVFIKSGLTKTCFVLICNGSKAFIGGLTENTVFLQSNDIKEEMFNGKALYFSSYSLIDKD